MCDALCSRLLVNLAILVSGAAVTAQPQLRIAWSENSIGPLMRAKMPVPPGRRNNMDNILLRFYNGTTPSEVVSVRLAEAPRLLETAGFDARAPSVLYIHGYIELATDESVVSAASAYLEARPEYNVLVLDWSNMAYGQYLSGALNVKRVGVAMARQLLRLVRAPRGLALERLHLVGHSLGAHIAGQIGRSMRSAGHVLPRISGLDPAFPGFYPALLGTPLLRSDARFVDAVHTDGGMYGTPLSTAHADFWPNGGVGKQPGCDALTVLFSYEDFCSHHRSWRFWAESVRARKAFPARRCADYKSFVRADCEERPPAYMGHDATSELRGDYYLTTRSQAPFSSPIQAA